MNRNQRALESERRRQFDAEQRINLAMARSEDPVEREAAALITRMGRSWYYTESQARAVARFAAKEILDLKKGNTAVDMRLEKIDPGSFDRLERD